MQLPTAGSYRPDIDGLRAIAVLSVMAYHLHAAWIPGGFVGVDVFFVISGFVVTASLASNGGASLPAFIAEFYARRLARIFPALMAVLVASALAATLFIPPGWLSGFSDTTAKYALFGLSNWAMQRNVDTYFAPRAEFNPFTHTWSLGVEEQFYVLTPLLVYFWVRAVRHGRGGERHLAIAGLALVTSLSIAACIWANKRHPEMAFYFIGCRLWELALGALLFLVSANRPAITDQRPPAWRQCLPWIGLVCIGLSFFHAKAADFPWPWATLPVAGTLLLIEGAGASSGHWVRRLLATDPVVWVGKRSYSLYLWHWPVYVLLRWTTGLHTALLFGIALVITFLLAMASFRWIEQPFRHHAWIESQSKRFRIGIFLLLPLVGWVILSAFFQFRTHISLSSVARSTIDWHADLRMPYPDFGDRQCQVDVGVYSFHGGQEWRYTTRQCRDSRDKVRARKMIVLGDSHAIALAPMLEQLSAEQGTTISIFTFPACSYLDLRFAMDDNRPAGCPQYTRAITDHVLKQLVAGDIVFLPSLRMQRYGDQWASLDIPDMYERMYDPQAMQLRQAAFEDARQWLQRFANKQIKVVFLAPTPLFRAPPFRCSDWFNHMNPICIGENQQARAELERVRQPVVNSMHALAQAFPNVSVWDPFSLLCPDATCRAHRDGRPLFFDGDHLSAYGNAWIYPDFKKTILELSQP